MQLTMYTVTVGRAQFAVFNVRYGNEKVWLMVWSVEIAVVIVQCEVCSVNYTVCSDKIAVWSRQ